MSDEKSGMINIDKNRPLIENGKVQLRLSVLMSHPDYNLDKAFGGRGSIGSNRNEELDQMPIVDLLIDAKRRIEEEVRQGGRWANDYGYAGFMTDSWERAVRLGMVSDDCYSRDDYIHDGMYFNGHEAISKRIERCGEKRQMVLWRGGTQEAHER